MAVFTILLFLIFSLLCVKYVLGRGMLVGSPFNSAIKMPITGVQSFLLLLLLTGLLRFGFGGLALDLSAIKLLMLLLVLFIGIFVAKGTSFFSLPLLFLSIYLIWSLLSLLFFSSDIGFGIRTILKYLFPLVVLIYASKCSVNEILGIKILKLFLYVTLAFEVLYFFPYLLQPFPGLLCTWATFSDHISVAVLVSFSLYSLSGKKKYLFFCILLLLFPTLKVIRTGLLAIAVGGSIYFLVKYKLKSLPFVVTLLGLFIVSIIYIPGVREKMFGKQISAEELIYNYNQGKIDRDDINTSARQAMWDWALKTYYEPNKVVGSGVGTLQSALYDKNVNPFPFNAIHSDYVQILCDIGLIGLVLYLGVLISMIAHCTIIYNNKRNNRIIKEFAVLSCSSLAAIMTCSLTNNTVNFTMATYCYPFAFYGITLFLVHKRKMQEN